MTAVVTSEPRVPPLAGTSSGVPTDPVTMRAPAIQQRSGLLSGMGAAFWCFVIWLGVVVVMAIGGKSLPWVKNDSDYVTGALVADGQWRKSFSFSHLLGVDASGNDMLSIITIGARNSMIIAFTTIIVSFLIGGTLGMIAGYARGKIDMLDTVLSFFMTALQSFPPILFIVLVLSIKQARSLKPGDVQQGFSTSIWTLSFTLAILTVPTLFRVVRASTIQFSQREFVLAARSIGAKSGRVLSREILPNVAKPMIAYGLVGAGAVMVIEGSLSYLGLGIGDSWAWGKIIQSGAGVGDIKHSPNVAFVPMAVLFMTVLAFNFIGDKVREKLEVKQAGI